MQAFPYTLLVMAAQAGIHDKHQQGQCRREFKPAYQFQIRILSIALFDRFNTEPAARCRGWLAQPA
jgi:hypothetical protein